MTTGTRSAAERLLDHAIELTFPASDPIAVDHAFLSAHDKAREAARATPDMRKAMTHPPDDRPGN